MFEQNLLYDPDAMSVSYDIPKLISKADSYINLDPSEALSAPVSELWHSILFYLMEFEPLPNHTYSRAFKLAMFTVCDENSNSCYPYYERILDHIWKQSEPVKPLCVEYYDNFMKYPEDVRFKSSAKLMQLIYEYVYSVVERR